MTEKRLYPRKIVNTRVILFHDSFGEVESIARDISNGGVFVIVQPEHELAVDSQLKMVIPGSSDPSIIFNMKVVRHDKAGMGLMFCNFEADGQQHEMSHLNRFWSR